MPRREDEPMRRPTRAEFVWGPRLYSAALSQMHDEAADADPADPAFAACDGNLGHPEMVCVGDMADREAVLVFGEVGGICSISNVEPGWRRRVGHGPDKECADIAL